MQLDAISAVAALMFVILSFIALVLIATGGKEFRARNKWHVINEYTEKLDWSRVDATKFICWLVVKAWQICLDIILLSYLINLLLKWI